VNPATPQGERETAAAEPEKPLANRVHQRDVGTGTEERLEYVNEFRTGYAGYRSRNEACCATGHQNDGVSVLFDAGCYCAKPIGGMERPVARRWVVTLRELQAMRG